MSANRGGRALGGWWAGRAGLQRRKAGAVQAVRGPFCANCNGGWSGPGGLWAIEDHAWTAGPYRLSGPAAGSVWSTRLAGWNVLLHRIGWSRACSRGASERVTGAIAAMA